MSVFANYDLNFLLENSLTVDLCVFCHDIASDYLFSVKKAQSFLLVKEKIRIKAKKL